MNQNRQSNDTPRALYRAINTQYEHLNKKLDQLSYDRDIGAIVQSQFELEAQLIAAKVHRFGKEFDRLYEAMFRRAQQ